MAQREHIEQKCLFDWAFLQKNAHPQLDLLYAIPNGARVASYKIAKRLKAEGLKPGIPDVHLPVARGGFHSLYIEIKSPGDKALGLEPGRVQPHQRDLHIKLRAEGNRVEVCFGWRPAADLLLCYLASA